MPTIKFKAGGRSYQIDTDKATIDDLYDALQIVSDAYAHASGKIEQMNIDADESGELPDSDQYRRTLTFSRIMASRKAMLEKIIETRLSIREAEEKARLRASHAPPPGPKAQRRAERASLIHMRFVDVARVILTGEQFESILAKATEIAEKELAKKKEAHENTGA